MSVAPRPDPLAEAVETLRAGGLVAYPTETVWGLAADASNPQAVARLLAWKGREAARPMAVLVEDLTGLDDLGLEVNEAAHRLAAAFWPGPLTLVLPAAEARVAPGVARGDGAVGVRCSPHPLARALARAAREAGLGPITATSLNRSGEPPARNAREVLRTCGAAADAAFVLGARGPDAGGSEPSTVVDCTGKKPLVLRYGALDAAALAPYLTPEEPA